MIKMERKNNEMIDKAWKKYIFLEEDIRGHILSAKELRDLRLRFDRFFLVSYPKKPTVSSF